MVVLSCAAPGLYGPASMCARVHIVMAVPAGTARTRLTSTSKAFSTAPPRRPRTTRRCTGRPRTQTV
jgi:hypothetical protein